MAGGVIRGRHPRVTFSRGTVCTNAAVLQGSCAKIGPYGPEFFDILAHN